jgi:hypothetical protein
MPNHDGIFIMSILNRKMEKKNKVEKERQKDRREKLREKFL